VFCLAGSLASSAAAQGVPRLAPQDAAAVAKAVGA